MFLLGLLIDFWAQWLPSKKSAPRPDGPTQHYVLPKQVRSAISERQGHMLLTQLFSKPYRDITKCVLTGSGQIDGVIVDPVACPVQVQVELVYGGLDGIR